MDCQIVSNIRGVIHSRKLLPGVCTKKGVVTPPWINHRWVITPGRIHLQGAEITQWWICMGIDQKLIQNNFRADAKYTREKRLLGVLWEVEMKFLWKNRDQKTRDTVPLKSYLNVVRLIKDEHGACEIQIQRFSRLE